MQLKPPLWASEWKESLQEEDSGPHEPATAMEGLVRSLNKERLFREVTFALRSGLRDAGAEFSFLRVRGLRSIVSLLRTVSRSDSAINLFRESQSLTDLQVVPLLFRHSLKKSEDVKVDSLDHIFGVEPMMITSPVTDDEVSLALSILECCCLLHHESTIFAHQHNAVQVLMNILTARGSREQSACLDALISIMLDSSLNQLEFEGSGGVEVVIILLKDKKVDESLRVRCGEFLLLLAGVVNGKESPAMAQIHEDVRRLLGEVCASLIWAASQVSAMLDPEQRLSSLRIHARRVLESVDL